MYFSAIAKSLFDAYLMDTTITTRYSNFALPLTGSTGDTLQLCIYFGLAMAVTPGLFALYPSFERSRDIKALQYSNGVRPGPLWLAHLLFDSIFVTIISVAALAIFLSVSDVWYSLDTYSRSSSSLAYLRHSSHTWYPCSSRRNWAHSPSPLATRH